MTIICCWWMRKMEKEREIGGGGSVGGLVRGYELPGRAMGCMDGLIR